MRVIKNRMRSIAISDEGLTLVEIIIAISLIAIVATASAALCIGGVNAATKQERGQTAVTIANGAMESINSRSAVKISGKSPLFAGRYIGDVAAAFNANVGKPGVANTYPIGDSSVTAITANPVIPITSTMVESGTTYTVTTLIGSCYQSTAANGAGVLTAECGLAPGFASTSAPTSAVSGYSDLIRVIIVVSWTAGKQCGPTPCAYTATSLIDPNVDLTWVTHG